MRWRSIVRHGVDWTESLSILTYDVGYHQLYSQLVRYTILSFPRISHFLYLSCAIATHSRAVTALDCGRVAGCLHRCRRACMRRPLNASDGAGSCENEHHTPVTGQVGLGFVCHSGSWWIAFTSQCRYVLLGPGISALPQIVIRDQDTSRFDSERRKSNSILEFTFL